MVFSHGRFVGLYRWRNVAHSVWLAWSAPPPFTVIWLAEHKPPSL
jgi:hypothetical protein